MENFYALTWNPKPRSFINTDDYKEDLFKEHLLCIKYIQKYVVFMVPEISDNNKLHYHGICKIANDEEFVEYFRRITKLKRKGFVVNKKLISERAFQGWVEYCGKSWNRTKTAIFLDLSKMECDDYKLLTYEILEKIQIEDKKIKVPRKYLITDFL